MKANYYHTVAFFFGQSKSCIVVLCSKTVLYNHIVEHFESNIFISCPTKTFYSIYKVEQELHRYNRYRQRKMGAVKPTLLGTFSLLFAVQSHEQQYWHFGLQTWTSFPVSSSYNPLFLQWLALFSKLIINYTRWKLTIIVWDCKLKCWNHATLTWIVTMY